MVCSQSGWLDDMGMSALVHEIALRHLCEEAMEKVIDHKLDVDTDYQRMVTDFRVIYKGQEYLISFRRIIK